MENPLTSSHFYFNCVEFSNKGQVILGLCILKQTEGSKTEMGGEGGKGKGEMKGEKKEGRREGKKKEGRKDWTRALFCNI